MNQRMPSGVGAMMKRFCVFVLLVLGACTDQASQVSDEPTATPASAYHDEPVEWFLRSISPDGKKIEIVYTMSGVASQCEKEGRATVTEKDEYVFVLAKKLVIDERNRPCTEELAYVDETVTLTQALGDRHLLGCRAGDVVEGPDPNEDKVCRDKKRSQDAGVFESDGSPPPAVPGY